MNEVAAKFGLAKGIKCSTLGSPESHKGCLANKALATKQATYVKAMYGEREVVSYWLPLAGQPEFSSILAWA